LYKNQVLQKMSNPKDIQQQLFQQVKSALPGHVSVVDEVAELLQMSTDSAYRRIRGEKMLTLDEMALLCTKYQLSMDGLLHLNGNSIIFAGQQIDFSRFELEQHLQFILLQLQQLRSFGNCRMFYLAKDVPVFHYFHFSRLAAFKFYAWLKTILHNPVYNNKKFILSEAVNDNWRELSSSIIDTYSSIPSEEIWSLETINSTIRQIEYCRDAMLFENEETVQLLYSELLQLVNHIEEQAAMGCKFAPGRQDENGGEFKLYYNGAILGDNTILMQMGEGRKVYLNHAILNYINTGDEKFCSYTAGAIDTIIQKSALISRVGEKERNKFFTILRNEVEVRMKK
jgi:hypothetical protein